MLINTVDEDGNSVELGGEFPLEENEHFNKLLVNTAQSDIQVPTNVYNKGQRSSSCNSTLPVRFSSVLDVSVLCVQIPTSSTPSTTLRR